MATILHVDMDAFFASVELLRHPEWRGKPLVVGAGPHERGVVSTCSYEARRFGVHSAMPSRTAYELCPQAIFTPPHMEFYREVSTCVFEIFEHYTPFIEGVSIDEAFLDISGTIHLYGNDPVRLGETLRDEIRHSCGVTCSVGIAPNRLLAKLGSEQNKPDGLTLMPFDPKAIADFLASRPVEVLWGVGQHTIGLLKPYGLTTCGDIQRADVALLRTILGSDTLAQSLHNYAFGIDSSAVAHESEVEKSVSREHTFSVDESNRETVRGKLLQLVEEVGYRFRREKRWARTARLKLRDAKFDTLTRQTPFPSPSRDDLAFRSAAMELFNRAWPNESGTRRLSIRLIGFGVSNIQTTPDRDDEPTLFATPSDAEREKRERLSAALDVLRERHLPANDSDDSPPPLLGFGAR